MSQDATPNCRTNLIRDIPSDTDSFAIHSRIAEAIVELVERERGGISVGISGSWGSGKSTIINFIQRKFKEDHRSNLQYHLWLFDAWEHEGDHLRRMFLESMKKSLQENTTWIDGKNWQDNLDYLAKRRKRSIQHDKPRINMFLVALAVTTLAIPVGSALLTNALYQRVVHYTFDLTTWEFRLIFPILLILAPAVLSLWIPVHYIILRYVCKNQQHSFKEFAESHFTWLLQRSATEVERIVMQDPDPTSIEFASTFNDMMEAALSSPERRFVIVIDNLDRIDTVNAKAIWSTLQTFLQVKIGEDDWRDRFFVVIPYDHNSISRIWGGENGKNQEFVESFLNKSFQIRFHVPITSDADWEDYLMGEKRSNGRQGILCEALPHHSIDDFHRVYRIYDVMRVRESQRGAPTPRELILYVNQIGALHRVWGDTIPISDLAYFTLLQSWDGNIHQGLLDGSIPQDSVMPYLALNVRDNLAALHFGVSIEHAQVLLLRGPILDALYRIDPTSLAELAKIYPRPFRTVLQRAITDIEVEQRITTVNEIIRAAETLSTLDQTVLGTEADTYVKRQLTVLCNRIHGVFKQLEGQTFTWSPPIEIEIDGFIRLATHDRDRRLVVSFVSLFGYLPLWESNGTAILKGITGYVQSLMMLYDKLKKTSLLLDDYAATVPGGPQVYRSVATLLRIEDPDRMYWHLFKPNRLLDNDLRLVNDIKETRYTNDHRMMLPVLKTADPSFDLLPVFREMLKALEERLTGMSMVDPTTAMLESLFEFMHEPTVADLVNQIAARNLYSYLLDLIMETNSIQLSAITIAILMCSAPGKLNYRVEEPSILHDLLEDPADDLVKRVVTLLGQSDAYENTRKAAPTTINFINACRELLQHSRDE